MLEICWWIVVLLLLAGVLVFAHGCHGDEDLEPFAFQRQKNYGFFPENACRRALDLVQ